MIDMIQNSELLEKGLPLPDMRARSVFLEIHGADGEMSADKLMRYNNMFLVVQIYLA